jgi:hypothetical protein
MDVVICWASAAVGATVAAANGTAMAAQLHSNANLFTEITPPENNESLVNREAASLGLRQSHYSERGGVLILPGVAEMPLPKVS